MCLNLIEEVIKKISKLLKWLDFSISNSEIKDLWNPDKGTLNIEYKIWKTKLLIKQI